MHFMKNTPLYITILFCLLISIAKAEITENVFDIQHLTTNDGLSSQRVFSIIEDKHGVIWVATKEGIDRYNGNSIKNYILSGEFSYGDMAGRVLRLYYSEQYGLWVYDQTGKIFKYLERNDTFSPFYALEQMIPGPITLNNFFIDESEVFWFGTQKGVYKKQQDGAIECVLSDKYITDIITVDNTTVIASSQGIFQINKDSIRVINQITDNLYIQSLYYDKTREQLWVGTFNDGLAVLNMKTDEWLYIESDEKNRNPIRSIIDYDSQFILVGIDGGGVYTVNKETHKTKQLMCNSDNIFRTRLLGNGVYTVLKDSQRNIWVGSYTGGVSVAILLKTPYTKFQHEFSNNNTLANNNVNDIEENSDGNLWFSTDSGISICDMKTGKWTHILNEIVATSISRGEDGTMWVGTYGKGVYQFNKEGKKLAHLTTQTGDLTTNYTLAIHFDDKANLWIGGLGGKLVLLNQKNKYRQLFDIEWVQSIQSVYNDTLAVATTSGLYLIDKSDKKVHEYASNVQYKNMNMSSYIISMLFNDDKTVWLGTDGGGLCLYNILTNDIQILTTSDGLPDRKSVV